MRSWLALLTCFAAVFVASAEPPARGANRFLFVVDTSSSMKLMENTVRETVFDFVYSGLHGRMTNGDTYGIWLVSNENDTSFAMETWRPKYNVELGARATVHLKDHGYKGQARLEVAITDALRIVKRVHDLTIVLISNGETPVAGTPFDAEINSRCAELAPLMKKEKKTLNTVLVAQDGAIAAWAVNSPAELVNLPYVPPKAVKPEIAAVKTNGLAASREAERLREDLAESGARGPTNAEPPKPRIASNPIIITKDTVAQEKRAYQALTTTGATNETAATPAPTNSAVAQASAIETNAAPAVTPTSSEPDPLVATTTNLPVAPSAPLVAAPATNHAETNAVVTKSAERTNVAAAANPAPAPPRIASAQTARSSGSGSIHPALWVAMGAGAASLGALTTVLMLRGRRREPSLISQAMVRQRIGSIIS